MFEEISPQTHDLWREEEGIAMIVLLLGPPGSGKGTHARLLSEHLGIPQVSMSDLLCNQISAKALIKQGKLVPDDLVVSVLFERLKQEDCAHGCILDGFPRTLSQAQLLDEKFKNKHPIIALHFQICDSVLIQRMAGRMICQTCKKPYHKLFDPPLEVGLCNDCGGTLITREDDQESIVRKRLTIYHTQTQPLIHYYAEQKNSLFEINAHQEKDSVFRDILEAIPPLKKGLMPLHR